MIKNKTKYQDQAMDKAPQSLHFCGICGSKNIDLKLDYVFGFDESDCLNCNAHYCDYDSQWHPRDIWSYEI